VTGLCAPLADDRRAAGADAALALLQLTHRCARAPPVHVAGSARRLNTPALCPCRTYSAADRTAHKASLPQPLSQPPDRSRHRLGHEHPGPPRQAAAFCASARRALSCASMRDRFAAHPRPIVPTCRCARQFSTVAACRRDPRAARQPRAARAARPLSQQVASPGCSARSAAKPAASVRPLGSSASKRSRAAHPV